MKGFDYDSELCQYLKQNMYGFSVDSREDLIQVLCELNVDVDMLEFYIHSDEKALKRWSKLIKLQECIHTKLEESAV